MSAAGAIDAARRIGVQLKVDGDVLVLEASAAPPTEVLDLLSRHKTGVAQLLRPGLDGWSAEEWQGLFEERAAIMEFDGGLQRLEAEIRAFAYCIGQWLDRNPMRSREPEAVAAMAAMGINISAKLSDDFGRNVAR